MTGFLGTGATWGSDLTLILEVGMGVGLLLGMLLARRRHYRAHAWCQSAIVLLNLALIALVMIPSFHRQFTPVRAGRLTRSYYALAMAHATLGGITELLGLYILLVAGTDFLPERFRFKQYKSWMRTELVLWWLVVFLGVGTYVRWYVVPLLRS